MTPDTLEDIAERLSIAYGVRYDPGLVRNIQVHLKDRNSKLVLKAISAHITDTERGQHPPTIADLLRQINLIEGLPEVATSREEHQKKYSREDVVSPEVMERSNWRQIMEEGTKKRENLVEEVRAKLRWSFTRMEHRQQLYAVNRAFMQSGGNLSLDQALEAAKDTAYALK